MVDLLDEAHLLPSIYFIFSRAGCQGAVAQWAAGVLPSVQLLGLAVIADAPGKRPKPLSDLVRLIAGGVPRLWELPWVEAFRLGDPPDRMKPPPAYARLIRDVSGLIENGTAL